MFDNVVFTLFCFVYLGAWLTLFRPVVVQKNIFSFSFISQVGFGLIFVAVPLLPQNTGLRSNSSLMFLVLVAYVGYLVAVVSVLRGRTAPQRIRLKTGKGVLCVFVLLWLGVTFGDVVIAIAEQGLWSMLTRNRLAERLATGGVGAGRSVLELLKFVLQPVGLIALFKLVDNSDSRGAGIWRLAGVAFFLLYLGLSVVGATHRTTILLPIGVALGYYHFCVRKLSLSMLSTALLVMFLFLAVSIPLRRGEWYEERPPAQLLLTAALDGFSTAEHLEDLKASIDRGKIEPELGKNLLYYNFITLIPRAFWSDKPVTSFNYRMTEAVFDREVGGGIKNPVRTFTVWGEGYAQFKWAGVLLYSLLFVGLYRGFFVYLARFEGTELIGLYYLLRVPLIMRAALDSILLILVVKIVLVFLWSRVLYRRRRDLAPSRAWREMIV